MWESWRKALTGKRPYRCRDCQWRGWAHDSGPHFSPEEIASAARALAPDPPNLQGTELARARTPQDFDLSTLDGQLDTFGSRAPGLSRTGSPRSSPQPGELAPR